MTDANRLCNRYCAGYERVAGRWLTHIMAAYRQQDMLSHSEEALLNLMFKPLVQAHSHLGFSDSKTRYTASAF
ncbi:hypothetical protein SIN8267_00133 [Sinobacterium norvegicum]|uniref:Uncharacterized protein n=1 Tax=Sinobacterium norvegicum TaxID=1641715 RepID=A0ABN8EC28_9GAMM|nr:hypothetical protein SIN8267_00133 [Sinobacterium norvegicum]